jgi:hypothetical protein
LQFAYENAEKSNQSGKKLFEISKYRVNAVESFMQEAVIMALSQVW